MNYVDLFSGIGGFRLGARWAGLEFEHEFHSDIDEYANKVYAKHFPNSMQLGDITKIDWHELKEKYKGEWLVTGGFPCQDISIAGKGAGLAGARSGLWFEMQKAISVLRPRFVVAENVGALTFRGLDAVLASLAEIGFDAEWQDIRASDVGAPHRRERVWIIAYPNEERYLYGQDEEFAAVREFNALCDTAPGVYSPFADDRSERIQGGGKKSLRRFNGVSWGQNGGGAKDFANRRDLPKPLICRVGNGLSKELEGTLGGFGNSIVPQIARILFLLIKPHLK